MQHEIDNDKQIFDFKFQNTCSLCLYEKAELNAPKTKPKLVDHLFTHLDKDKSCLNCGVKTRVV